MAWMLAYVRIFSQKRSLTYVQCILMYIIWTRLITSNERTTTKLLQLMSEGLRLLYFIYTRIAIVYIT